MLQILNQTVCLLHPVSESPKNTKLNQIYFKSLTSDLTHDDKTQSLRCNRSANRPGVATTITHLCIERERENILYGLIVQQSIKFTIIICTQRNGTCKLNKINVDNKLIIWFNEFVQTVPTSYSKMIYYLITNINVTMDI